MRTDGRNVVAAFWFLGGPFLVASMFNWCSWLGWPTLVVVTPLWIGALLQLGEKKS